MSRTHSPSVPRSSTDTLSTDLDKLLQRLEAQLLSSTSDTSVLARSASERARIGVNVEYARTLLVRLDHASSGIRVQTRKASAQNSLAEKRELIKRLNQRLVELNQVDDDSSASDDQSDSDDDDEDEDEASRRDYGPAQKTSNQIDWTPLSQIPGLKGIPTSEPDISAAQTLRERGSGKSKSKDTPTTASEHASSTTRLQSSDNHSQATATTTSALFGDRDNKPSTSATTTQILEQTDHEHNLLTSSLVTLAQNLKSSSLAFQQSLAAEKEVLKFAEQGLEKNELGMESAGRRMGALRRMTEGQGWWGRIKLYALIAALWLACFLLVFLGPKLRF